MFWVAMSLRPEYNAKIDKMIALAPVAYVDHLKSPVRIFAPLEAEAQVRYLLFTVLKTFSKG